MEKQVIFKSALNGFEKTSVLKYIDELNSKLNKAESAHQEQLEELENEKDNLCDQVAALEISSREAQKKLEAELTSLQEQLAEKQTLVEKMEAELKKLALEEGAADSVTILGYQTNPYKYVAKCDLFICSIHSEGFSTAATEALMVGTPVCTVEVSGMKEMLGENNEWGIVTENDEESLYQGIKRLLDDPALLAHYKEKAAQRGKTFSTENTVKAVEEMLLSL